MPGAVSNQQLYAIGVVSVNGSPLAEEASLSIDRTTNSQPVSSVLKGYSGESPGAPMCEISVESNVPALDFELNPGKFMGTLQPVSFTFYVANKALTFSGQIYQDNFQHAVNSPSKLTFRARGSFSDWQ